MDDLLSIARYRFLRKFHHPSNIREAKPRGHPQYDNLHQICPMLETLASVCATRVKAGRDRSIDEETIGFQGASAELKQNCDRFKAAGDGLQADVVCLEGGWMQSFTFRGHSLTPTVTVKKPKAKLSPLHQRCDCPSFFA